MRDPACVGQGLHSVGTCYERSCVHGTGTAQCWNMLPEILPVWDRDCTVLGHASTVPEILPVWDREYVVFGHN